MGDVHYALWGLCLVVALLGLWGLLLFFGGFKRLFHGHMASGGSRVVFGLLFLFVFAFAAAVALDLRTYLRLTYERPVASLSFAAVGPQDFRATLTDASGRSRSVELRGDDWELDAQVLKWKGLATVLGMDPVYRLDRLEGRYRSAGQESHDYHSVLDLSADQGVDLWSLAHGSGGWLPGVDAVYGSGAYLPMVDGARYSVSLSSAGGGLIARGENKIAQDAIKQF